MDKMDTQKQKAIEALKKALGVVKTACEALKIPRSTFYLWIEKDPKFALAVNEVKEEAIDFVESKLFERIKGYEHPEDKIFVYEGQEVIVPTVKHYPPSDKLIEFYLKTRAKNRGYIEKTQMEITKGDDVSLDLD
jgi:hypothetical protein